MGEYINSQTARFDKSHISCGVVEVHHLPEKINKVPFAIATHLYHKANPRPGTFVIFSDAVDDVESSRGLKLANLLRKLSCGEVLNTSKEVNPRSGNTIMVWIFTVNHEKFRKWYQDELANRVED